MTNGNGDAKIVRRLSEWGGALSAVVILVIGIKFILDIRADFDSYVATQNVREVNCDKERAEIQSDVKEIKSIIEELKIFYYRNSNTE